MFNETPLQEALTPIADCLCKMREEAVKDRKSRGLDHIWARMREQYAGIDEKSRGRMSPIDGKSDTLDGPVYTRVPSNVSNVTEENRSTVFVNITRPYVNAGVARVQDILLPTGKMPFDLKLSPVGDMQLLRQTLQDYPEQLMALLELVPDAGAVLVQDEASAKAALEIAKQQVKDWLQETDWLGQIRLQISEAGKVGTGVLKGPFSKRRRVSSAVDSILLGVPLAFADNIDLGFQVQKQLESKLRYSPGAECVKVENCFPAPGCGRDFQNGKYFYERVSDVTKTQLEEYKDMPGYFPEQIDACIAEKPRGLDGEKKKPSSGYDLWIGYGEVDLSKLEESMAAPDDYSDKTCVFATWTLCNDRVIKLDAPTLPTKDFPYRMLKWEEREDSWDGIGISEHIETPQRGLNASVRALMDNMGYSVGPQVLEIEDLIEPKVGDDTQMRPYKHWIVKPGLPGLNVTEDPLKAMQFLQFPNYLNEIMPVIQFWMKIAEDTTGLPLLLQGQASTDAVGVSQQLMNNSTTNLRQIIKAWDDEVCKPQIQDFYTWCQEFGPKEAKGDAQVIALGSSTLLVKELQLQALMQIGDRVLMPAYGISPKKWMAQFLEGNQIDPDMLELDDEERERLEAAEKQPDPKVIAMQIEAQANVMIAQIKDATDRLKIYVDAQAKGASILQARDAVETQAAANITQETIKQEGQVEGQAGQGPKKPARPPAEPPEMDTEAALNTLGF